VENISAGSFFKGASRSATAAQWRTFARHYPPFAILEIWARNNSLKGTGSVEYNPRLTEKELQVQCWVIQIADISPRPTISSKQIAVLREHIALLQDYAYKNRPSFIKYVNMHWLVHLPDDIERQGPVNSWWLFGYERMNKTLKGANSVGHFRDTPLIAYNKFLRLGALGILGTHTAPSDDTAARTLAAAFERAFQHALANTNAIQEEQDAHNWQQERLQSETNFHRSRPSVISVDKQKSAALYTSDLEQICALWNRLPGPRACPENRPTTETPSDSVLRQHATYITNFRIGKYKFRTAPPQQRVPAVLKDVHLNVYKGCFVQWRTDGDILCLGNTRPAVCLIESLLEVDLWEDGAIKETRRYLKLQRLKAWEHRDPYRFKKYL
jgi:hypothetical protein